MLNKNVIEEINSKVSEILQNSPAKDVEKNMRAVLSGVFSRLDLVTRDEFDVQQEVLQRTREKLILLEAKVKEIEQQFGLSETGSKSAPESEITSENSQTTGAEQPKATSL
ncbi:accessory factor UbiK family protein [Nitrosomonas aestuarii]|uniref:Ubiquinone biosynthesis accessory factor UbiK n=1 Tax=Nitrosomonas aestuarii TaxID=52441 RepID=A0A1I3ZHS1_9PROT|nr:accessory factor UbiK family protein [Nitrosomonas aestuarii]PTN13115.1 hypothetical protein C8R11_10199 [Nitrosomonas aestuarii]SFK43638.1 hypothetical protein SAMN05216302_1006100 [Nitrosomonas aestuarii]